jgi:hypothetical protein
MRNYTPGHRRLRHFEGHQVRLEPVPYFGVFLRAPCSATDKSTSIFMQSEVSEPHLGLACVCVCVCVCVYVCVCVCVCVCVLPGCRLL